MMENILNDEDFDGFFDLPNGFSEDNLDDLDSLDFIKDLEESFILDCDVDLLNSNNSGRNEADIRCNSEFTEISNSFNYYRSCSNNNTSLTSNNNVTVKERCQPSNNMIRELLSSDTNINSLSSQRSYIPNNVINESNKRYNIKNEVFETCQMDKRNNTSKHPIILPATTPGHLIKNPTLAATLISMQTASNKDNRDIDSSSYGSGKGLRRNSHNAIEKRYRLSINDRIDELRIMLALGDNSKMNKSAVLRKAVERIKSLEEENNLLKCENYNLRKSYMMNTGTECLNGRSPLSNQSEGGQSISNSPSSSSMHSTSVSSSYLIHKNNENQPCIVTNPNKGLKRPLIYDNSSVPVKTEKLARLLLSSADSYDGRQSGHTKGISNEPSQIKRIHSSNMPGFLMCTMALFMVAFQPFDIILNNYRTKAIITTKGRTILQMPEVIGTISGDVGHSIVLVMIHWIVAFMLVWGSTNNRHLIRKFLSFLFRKARTMTFITLSYNSLVNGDTLLHMEERLRLWRKEDSVTFGSLLKTQLRNYHCECPTNITLFLIQLSAVFIGIVFSYLPFKFKKRQQNLEANKVAMCLVTTAVELSFLREDFCGYEALWYKAVLMLIIRHSECDDQTMYSKLILSQCISVDIIRRYFVNRNMRSNLSLRGATSDKYRCLLTSPELKKIFIKTSLVKLKEKLHGNFLMMRTSTDAFRCYYLAYVQDTLLAYIKTIFNDAQSPNTSDCVNDIIMTSETFLSKDESVYISILCRFILSAKDGNNPKDIEILATKLMQHYNSMLSKSNNEHITHNMDQLIYTFRLFLATTRLYNGNDMLHDLNLDMISHITKTSITNVITRLIFEMSIDVISNFLNRQEVSLTVSSSIIYYANKYNAKLSEYSESHKGEYELRKTNFEQILQKLCQVNPAKCGLPNVEHKEQVMIPRPCYRVTDFLSSDCNGFLEGVKSKMRSH